tara:strand:+ start:2633 stop:3163 length:531 start_codon:yes stop_codon:yes gene_type:complete
MSYEECQELKNIKYKTMLLSGNNEKLITSVTNDISNLDLLLDNESEKNKKESWNKLDKCVKMDKIDGYIDLLTKKHKLENKEKLNLKSYLSSILDKKNLTRNKDVIYIKETGVIENIPILQFNNTTRKFSLKRNSQHVSTIKSLGPTKKNNKNRSRSNKSKLLNSPKSDSNKSDFN